MARKTSALGFSVSPALAREYERIVERERTTRSGLFRRMVTTYKAEREGRKRLSRSSGRWPAVFARRVCSPRRRSNGSCLKTGSPDYLWRFVAKLRSCVVRGARGDSREGGVLTEYVDRLSGEPALRNSVSAIAAEVSYG
jgi:hypothetical protein